MGLQQPQETSWDFMKLHGIPQDFITEVFVISPLYFPDWKVWWEAKNEYDIEPFVL